MNEVQFTCVSFDRLELLIPRDYIAAAFYLESTEEKSTIVFNEETLPHLNFSKAIQRKFNCNTQGQSDFALIIDASDWESDICKRISDYTSTKFPKSGNFALSFNTEIYNQIIKINEFSFFPGTIREYLKKRGFFAIRFAKNKSQFLVALDFIVKNFLEGDMGETL